MNIFIYSDESGVLDKYHNDYYVFGGLVFVSSSEKDECSRRYIAAERNIRISENIETSREIKASVIRGKSKRKLYNSVCKYERFGVVVNQKNLLNENLFSNKKTKQRYLDWLYKVSVKKKLEDMIRQGIIVPDEVKRIYFMVDEHSTATDGMYELRESLEKEFKIGMWNFEYMTYHDPLFKNIDSVELQYCNSSKTTLVRASDIIANHILREAILNNGIVPRENKLHIYYHPN